LFMSRMKALVAAFFVLTHSFNCPNGSVQVLDVYSFHPTDLFNVSDHDYGDIVGDTYFGCGQWCPSCPPIAPTPGSNTLLTHLRIQVNTSWGPYARCLDSSPGSCVNGDGKSVGRELPDHPSGNVQDSQCSNLSSVGNWWSLEEGGRCNTGREVGSGCTWRVIEIVRTIMVDCLLRHGFTAACRDQQFIPWSGGRPIPYYPSAASVFERAISRNETQPGGCPAVPLHLGFG